MTCANKGGYKPCYMMENYSSLMGALTNIGEEGLKRQGDRLWRGLKAKEFRLHSIGNRKL